MSAGDVEDLLAQAWAGAWTDDEEAPVINLQVDLSDPSIYEDGLPPDIRTILTDPFFLGGQVDWDEPILEILEDIDRPDVRVAYCGIGRGSGKSELAVALEAVGAIKVLMLRDPHAVFGLGRGDMIACVNVSTTGQNAMDVVFRRLKKRIELSPFFQQFRPKAYETRNPPHARIEFLDPSVYEKSLHLFSGTSTVAGKLGYAIPLGVMDEANFFLDGKLRQLAAEMSRAILGSMTTRFPHSHKLIAISSANDQQSWLTVQADLIRRLGRELEPYGSAFVERLERCPDTFPGMMHGDRIVETLKSQRVRRHQHAASLAIDAPTYLLRKRLPLDNYLEELANPSKRRNVLLDIGNIPHQMTAAFFPDATLFEKLGDAEKRCPIRVPPDHPGVLEGQDEIEGVPWNPEFGNPYPFADWFVPEPGTVLFIGCDYSTNKDATGLSFVWQRVDGEILFYTVQIRALPGKTVDYRPIRASVRYLRDVRGFRIGNMSCDQHQSGDTVNIMGTWGIEAKVVRHDTQLQSCSTVQEMFLTGRMKCGLEEVDAVLRGEMAELIIVNGKRVDHRPAGGLFNSKDVWDSLVNGTIECLTDQRSAGIDVGDLERYDPDVAFQVLPVNPLAETEADRFPNTNGLEPRVGLLTRYDQKDTAADYVAIASAVLLPSGKVALVSVHTGSVQLDDLPRFVGSFVDGLETLRFRSRFEDHFAARVRLGKSKVEKEIRKALGPDPRSSTVPEKGSLQLDAQARYLQRVAADGDLIFPDQDRSSERLELAISAIVGYPYVPERSGWLLRALYLAVHDAARGVGGSRQATSAAVLDPLAAR